MDVVACHIGLVALLGAELPIYSTNEPIVDGTANLAYLLSAMARHQD